MHKVLAHVVLGIALVANEEWNASEDAERRALETARTGGVGFGVTAWALRFPAEARLGRGENPAALELAEEALTEARQSGGRLFEMDALLTRAPALLRSAGAARANEARRSLAEARQLIGSARQEDTAETRWSTRSRPRRPACSETMRRATTNFAKRIAVS